VVVAFIFIRSSENAHAMDADPEHEDAGAR